MQETIVYILFGAAILFLGYRAYQKLSPKKGKSCGTDNCGCGWKFFVIINTQ